MTLLLDDTRGNARLSVKGRFTFDCRREFREHRDAMVSRAGVRTITVDLRQASYIDSSALGMLLQLRDKAEAQKQRVQLAVQCGMALEVLRVARFERLFELVDDAHQA